MRMNVVVLGSPGVGKGTYTTLVSKRFNLPHISTGDMFRENIKNNSELGKEAKSYMDKGLLVPDEIVTAMLKKRLESDDVKKGFLLDGYPRNLDQVELLKEFVEIDKVLNFVASDEVIIDRLSGRRVCKKCGSTFHVRNVPPKVEGVCDNCGGDLYQRKNDLPEAIKKRLEVYSEQTAPLVSYYREKGLLVDVDVNTPYEENQQNPKKQKIGMNQWIGYVENIGKPVASIPLSSRKTSGRIVAQRPVIERKVIEQIPCPRTFKHKVGNGRCTCNQQWNHNPAKMAGAQQTPSQVKRGRQQQEQRNITGHDRESGTKCKNKKPSLAPGLFKTNHGQKRHHDQRQGQQV